LGGKKKKKLTSKGLSNSACNLVASVEVLIEQLEIYIRKIIQWILILKGAAVNGNNGER
jgi:hypothetical protein